MAASQRRLSALMFTDMVGYSALAHDDEAAALETLAAHNRLLRSIFRKHAGREVKTVGDAFLVEFDSALEAATCALEIQRTLHERQVAGVDRRPIRVRIGLHLGDVVRTAGDVLGDAVNVASRIEALADPDGICLTQQVYDQVQNKLGAPLVKLPPTVLKNIRTAVGVYRVVQPWEEGAATSLRAVPTGGRHLAVLPLANISPDPHDEYFADGLTEELIAALSRIRDLSVIARTSVLAYKREPKSVAQVGQELQVDSVLEGSVRKAGNRIRITLQLIDVSTQGHVWSASYNRELDDVFAVQTEIAERTADALQLELRAKGSERAPTANLAAYDAYLRGLSAQRREDGAGIAEAVRNFEQAIALDPGFAEAYAALADLYVAAAGDHLPMRDVMPKARALAARALEIEPELSDAHSALGNIAFQFDQDWTGAEREFQRALQLNPNNVSAHTFYGLMLIGLDRLDEARAEERRRLRLDPSGNGRSTLGLIDLLDGRFDAACETFREEAAASPNDPRVHVYYGLILLGAGRPEQARQQAAFPLGPDASEEVRFDHALLAALLGETAEARAVAAEVESGRTTSYTSRTALAMLYAALGDRGRALDLLEEDHRDGDRVLWLYYRGVWFDGIRSDPRFVALLQVYGVPTGRVRGQPRPSGSPPS
ncbi:MAG TPA: adenylate/guanylate cyclase domain-containing protein [Thermoplasmata archaeon]|nr:adenylate/guanylate cyclase domain-containing protein [Thermoplasmata archaeon]